MNLKDILDHRKTCLIHNEPMEPYAFRTDVSMVEVDQGLLVIELDKMEAPYKKAIFNHDGTFSKDKGMGRIFKSPLVVHMCCSECKRTPIHKSRGLGITTLLDIRSVHHYYTFTLMADAEGNYDGNLGNEIVRYWKDNKFYHLDVDLSSKKANFKMGTNAGTDILERLLEGLLDLTVPNFDPKKLTSVEQMIEKFKLYNLFS